MSESRGGLIKSRWAGPSLTLEFLIQQIPMDGGVWRATVHGVTKSRTRLSLFMSFSVTELCSAFLLCPRLVADVSRVLLLKLGWCGYV